MNERATGTVKLFDVVTGSGFISRERGEQDCLLAHSAIQGTALGMLTAGQRVEFDLVEGARGPAAHNVVRLG